MKWCKQIVSVGSLVIISNIRCALLNRHPYPHLRTFGTRCGAGWDMYGASIEGVITSGIEARLPGSLHLDVNKNSLLRLKMKRWNRDFCSFH